VDDLTDPAPSKDESELAIEGALRPSSLAEFVGQTKVRGQLQLLLDAAAFRSDPPITSCWPVHQAWARRRSP